MVSTSQRGSRASPSLVALPSQARSEIALAIDSISTLKTGREQQLKNIDKPTSGSPMLSLEEPPEEDGWQTKKSLIHR